MWSCRLPVERRVDISTTHQHETVESTHHRFGILSCQRLRRNYDWFATRPQNCIKVSTPRKRNCITRNPTRRTISTSERDER
jgi:hypothetical protein